MATEDECPSANGGEAAFSLIQAGTDLGGTLSGAAVGVAVAGPVGAVVGAALGPVIQHAALAIYDRIQGRQRDRAGAALAILIEDSKERADRGEHSREDGFFESKDGRRPDAEDLLEGVLLQAANAFEERKVPLLARLYAGVAHDSSVSAETGILLVRMAGEMTYRQFVALAVFANQEQHADALNAAEAARQEGDARPDLTILLEIDDLGVRGLLGAELEGNVVIVGEAIGLIGRLTAQHPGLGTIRLSEAGETLARLARVSEIDSAEQDALVARLRLPV